jgi:Zn-finger nucleic acid-binding protein
MWVDPETFEAICVEREKQSAVFDFVSGKTAKKLLAETKVRYVPCPECRELMNRKNFAQSSGVIVDICRTHGIWFDANELPEIIDFILKGGLDRQRTKEKIQLEDERRRIRELTRGTAISDESYTDELSSFGLADTALRGLVRLIFK